MALAENRKNIETLNKYIDRLQAVQKQLEGLSKGTDEYNKKLIQKTNLEKQAAQASRKLSESQGRLENTLPKHRKLIDEAAKAQKRYSSSTTVSTKSNKGFFSSLGKTIKTLSRLALSYKIIQGATALFNEVFIKSAKRAIAFEKAMADLRAVAAFTKEDLEGLRKVVFEVAGTTSFTAIQIAELQKQLGKLGASAEEIGQLTKPVALLSQALGEEPGGVAESLKKALNQFGLTSAAAFKFSNIMVGAVNESALTLNDLGTSLQYVGPLASQVGLTFDQTAAFLGTLSNNGLKASRAGTGLRKVLSEAAKEGIPFTDFVEKLAKNNLDAAEAFEIFGQRGAGAALILAQNIDEYKNLNKELNDSTRLLKANAVQMSSTQGQIDLLSSAYNRASIRLGDYITQTEFFIEIIERLDPTVAAQARVYKSLANATGETSEKIELLTRSMSDFQLTEEEQVDRGKMILQIMRETGAITLEQSNKFIDASNDQKSVLEVLRSSAAEGKGVYQDLAEQALAYFDVLSQNSNAIRESRIETAASNENYKEAELLLSKLTKKAKEAELTEKERLRVTEGLGEKVAELYNQYNTETDKEQLVILQKRIAMFEEIIKKVNSLENSESAIEKKKEDRAKAEKKRIKDELKDVIDSIKEQERVIKEDLSKDISDEQFLTQVNLLNALFGSAEDIIAEAEKVYGKDSDFVADLKDVFGDAASEVAVAIPQAAKNTMDITTQAILDTIDFIKNNRDMFSFEDVIIEGIERTAAAIDDFADVRQENFENEQKAKLDSLKRNGSIEEDILRAQLDNQLITESQFRAKKLELQKAQIAKENNINKKIFESKQKQDRIDAATDLAVALASIIPNMFKRGEAGEPVTTALKAKISAGLAAASFAAEIAAINSRKFVPRQFEQGGMVSGPSHAEGGVPFTVQGQGGYEMEGGEFIVNKRATAMHRDLLERINNSQRVKPLSGAYKFAQGGIVAAQTNESVDYLKAIAEATTSTAIQTSKPMRAFISGKDLRSNETERRLRDRNDRI